MSDNHTDLGQIQATADTYTGTLRRLYPHDVDALWTQLTDASAMAQWLAPGTIELQANGAVHIDFVDSGITIDSHLHDYVPQRVLAYSWSSGDEPQRPLRWELEPVAGGTRLHLHVTVPRDEDIAKACAGFAAHLEMLAAVLEGVSIKFPFDTYTQARTTYTAQLEALE